MVVEAWLIVESGDTLTELRARAERERLARQAVQPSPTVRARVARALRSIANRLEGGAPAGGRQLAAAR